MTSRNGRCLQPLNIRGNLGWIGKEMKRGAIMPEIVDPVGLPLRHIGCDPTDLICSLAQSCSSSIESSGGEIEHSDRAESSNQQGIDKPRCATADIYDCGGAGYACKIDQLQ